MQKELQKLLARAADESGEETEARLSELQKFSAWSRSTRKILARAVMEGKFAELRAVLPKNPALATMKCFNKPLHILVIDGLVYLCEKLACTSEDAGLVISIMDDLFNMNRKGFESHPPLDYAEKKIRKQEAERIPPTTLCCTIFGEDAKSFAHPAERRPETIWTDEEVVESSAKESFLVSFHALSYNLFYNLLSFRSS